MRRDRLNCSKSSWGTYVYIYTYTDAAKAAGPPELLANPTFTFMLEIDAFDLEKFMTFLGETLEKFLDGEENFTYYAPIYASDKITVYKKLLIS